MHKLLAVAFVAWAGSVTGAPAQVYPSRPITMIIGLAPGGAVDVLARGLAEHMKGTLGQPIVVENVSGAGGTVGTGRVVRAPPDGYTLGMGTAGQYVVNGAVYALSYDLLKDFEPVVLLPSVPYWMVARKTMPPNDLKGLIAWLKANPASAATVGTASLSRLCGVLVPEPDRHQFPVHSLSGRRTGAAGPGGRPDRHHMRSGGQFAAAGARRQSQGLCGDVEEALVWRARYSDRGGSRRARSLM